jgi:hypothetical protein
VAQILNTNDLLAMSLPADLSGYDPLVLAAKLQQAEAWVNAEARYQNGFAAHRIVDRVFGTGTNKLMTTFYPVLQLNSIHLIFPANQGNVNLPGGNQVPIDPSRVVIDHQAGLLENWSPFVFQTIGYLTVFPEHVPINIDYYTGYIAEQATTGISAGATYIPVTNASCYYYGQSLRVYDPLVPEFLTVMGTTTQGSVQAVVVQDAPQFNHAVGTTLGDMPSEVRLATALVACDYALRELNPEDLMTLKEGDITKTYQGDVRSRSLRPSETDPALEVDRELIMEARRLLRHYHADRGVF